MQLHLFEKPEKMTDAMKKDSIRSNAAPPCRFWFFRIVEVLLQGTKRKVRRRGKHVCNEPFVQTSNEHNELGLVQPRRCNPFRGPTSDIAQSALRCNFDYRFMLRGFTNLTEVELTCDVAQIRQQLLLLAKVQAPDAVVKSLLASFIAARNADHYICKYQSKPLEQLQNVSKQYADGLGRLEREFPAECLGQADGDDDATNRLLDKKQKAKRIIMRLATSANRSTWVSATEMALLIHTQEHFWSTHYDVPIFLQKAKCMMEECKRLLNGNIGSNSFVLHARTVEVGCVDLTNARPVEESSGSSEPDTEVDETHHPQDELQDDCEDVDEPGVDDDANKIEEPSENNSKNLIFRATTSAFDDWLHRGPFLYDLPFEMYVCFIERVRKPNQTASRHKYFLFDEHYDMSRLYCQTLRAEPVLGRLVGSDCPGFNHEREGFAAFHLLLFQTNLSCPGVGGCSDPTALAKALFPLKPSCYCFWPVWRARKAEIKTLADKAFPKIDNAKKIAVLQDTTLFKQCQASEANKILQTTLLQLMMQKYHCILWRPWTLILSFLSLQLPIHADQLHLDEFVAAHLMEVINNLFLQQVSKKKPLQCKSSKDVIIENELDEEELTDRHPQERHVEFYGGEGDDMQADLDHITMQDERSKPDICLTMQDVHSLLSRSQEIARLHAPGKNKESDMHMGKYADIFADAMARSLPELQTNSATLQWQHGLLQQPLRWQESVVQLARKGFVESCPEEIHNDFATYKSEDLTAACLVQIPTLLQGPGKFAWELLQKHNMNEEQINCAALIIWPLEQAFRRRPHKESIQLPLTGALSRIAIIGGGGCGKTTLLLKIIHPTIQAYLQDMLCTAPSNKAARGVRGKTAHNVSSLTPFDSWRTSQLRISSDSMRKKLFALWSRVGGVAIDEFSQLPAALLHAMALRATYARRPMCSMDLASYAEQPQLFGAMPIVVILGDHLQLPPIPRTSSLLHEDLSHASEEQKAGAAIFANLKHIFLLQKTMRFTCPLLKSILEKMRRTDGAQLTKEERSALLQTRLDADVPLRPGELKKCNLDCM